MPLLAVKKVKVAHTLLPNVGFRSWSRFLAVSLQVMWVINPVVGCHYFLPGLQLPRNPQDGCYQFWCLVNRGTMGVNSLPKTVTRQRHDCDLNLGPSVPESTLSTRLPSHPYCWQYICKIANSQFLFAVMITALACHISQHVSQQFLFDVSDIMSKNECWCSSLFCTVHVYWNCSHSMLSRVYVTDGRPSVRLCPVIRPLYSTTAGLLLCPVGRRYRSLHCQRSAAASPQHGAQQQMRAVSRCQLT